MDIYDNEIFEACPVCFSKIVVRLIPNWQGFGQIDIVGCGNPWHYAVKSLGDEPDGNS